MSDNDFEGLVKIFQPLRRIYIDAKPYVMQKIKPFFSNLQNSPKPGKYTPRPFFIPLTTTNAKDIEMFAARYGLAMSEEDSYKISILSEKYDQDIKAAKEVELQTEYVTNENFFEVKKTPKEHQITGYNTVKRFKRVLVADPMGKGKTLIGNLLIADPECRPALVVVPPNITEQWKDKMSEDIPEARVHIIRGHKNYKLPKECDVMIISYTSLSHWLDALMSPELSLPFKSLIMDEVHDIRNSGTQKYDACKAMSNIVEYCAGFSGTPVMNYGIDIWNVLNVIKEGCLGDRYSFCQEWGNGSDKKVNDAVALNSYLHSQGLMIRREKKRVFGESRQTISISPDLASIEDANEIAKRLAMNLLSGRVGTKEYDDANIKLEGALRYVSGIAKARATVEFVKNIVDQGEKVLLVGWHHGVYDIYIEGFEKHGIKYVRYTGKESIAEKEEAKKRFINDPEVSVLIMSVRSGVGIDGLQFACSTVVFGELDWNPKLMDQVIDRVSDREGQTKDTNVFFLTTTVGLDPDMIPVLGFKRSQYEGIVEGTSGVAKVYDVVNKGSALLESAKKILSQSGEEIPEAVKREGLFGEILSLLERTRLPMGEESKLQSALFDVFNTHLSSDSCTVHREYRVDKKSRFDFFITNKDMTERIVIETKVKTGDRQSAYRQVRRYAKTGVVDKIIILAPWSGAQDFEVDGTPVSVVDLSKNIL